MAVRRKYVNVYPYVIQEGDCTIVDVSIDLFDEDERLSYSRSFSGSAVRNPIDKPNSDAGALIALGRALARAGERLQKVGEGLNKNDIDTKAEKLRQVEKNKRRDALNEATQLGQEMGGYDSPKLEEIFDAAERNKPDGGGVYE